MPYNNFSTIIDVDKEPGVGDRTLKYVYTVAGTPFVTAKVLKSGRRLSIFLMSR
jgi:hypothetical protein